MKQEIINDIINHARECYPNECCGLILDNFKYAPCRNLIPENENLKLGPQYNFAIDPKQYAIAEDKGEITHIVHSHPDASCRPSKEDIARCNESGLPWLIISYPSLDWRIIEPCEPDLIGRDFVLGVYDCYGLVMDYYKRELGIDLLDFRVDYPWWEQGENRYIDNYEKAGFREVFDLQKNDVILMQVSALVPNHAGILLDNNTLLHHLFGHKSCRTPYGGYYRERTVKILRYKNFG